MDGNFEPLTLVSDRLRVTVLRPGSAYTGPRFDWTTQVHHLLFDGISLLAREHAEGARPDREGVGLAGEFGIETPIGYEDCPVGGWFPKVGVGRLRRPDGEPYRFHRAYEVEPAHFEVVPEGNSAVVLSAQRQDGAFGWRLRRRWSVEGSVLTLATSLANTGTQRLVTEEYIHNFFGTASPLGPGWSLQLPAAVQKSTLAEWVDPEGLLDLGPPITWHRVPQKDFFLSAPPQASWTLRTPEGVLITEETDFPVSRFNLWGRAHVVSPELYRRIDVAPGQTVHGTRRWTFSRDPGDSLGGRGTMA